MTNFHILSGTCTCATFSSPIEATDTHDGKWHLILKKKCADDIMNTIISAVFKLNQNKPNDIVHFDFQHFIFHFCRYFSKRKCIAVEIEY